MPQAWPTDDVLDLARSVVAALAAEGRTLATAESLTAGMLAASIGGVPGASAVFRGAIVAYCDQAKVDLLAVPADTLHEHGAVSAPVAQAMALGACRALGADVAVATTGEAGPSSASGRPIGTVFLAVADQDLVEVRELRLQGSRNEIRHLAVRSAMDLLAGRAGTSG